MKKLVVPICLAIITLNGCGNFLMEGFCTEGATVCHEGYTNTCIDDTWVVGTICDSAEACIDMERVCSYGGIPNECSNGIWQPLGKCAPDESCSNGYCECVDGAKLCDENGIPWWCNNGIWTENDHCNAGDICMDGECVCDVNTPPVCNSSQALLVCNVTEGNLPKITEVPCMNDEYCEEGECRCKNNHAKMCDDSGQPWECSNHHWVQLETCAENETCADGICKCSPGEFKCTDNTSIRLRCDANGDWQPENCPPQEMCNNGICTCIDNKKSCRDGEPVICSDGNWIEDSACPDNTVCIDGACACAANYQKCQDEHNVSVCTPDHEWRHMETCPDGYLCKNGECTCIEDTRKCSLQGKPMTCRQGQWQTESACTDGTVCRSGNCVCMIASKKCSQDGKPMSCEENQAWITHNACSDGTICNDGTCIPPKCLNGIWDDDEEAVDCGGSCPACVSCTHDESVCTGNSFCDIAAGNHCQKLCTADDQCRDSEKWDGEYCRADGRCAPRVFETVWKVEADTTITLPAQQDAKCNFKVMWGDETETPDIQTLETITNCHNVNHTYKTAGEYRIKIIGTYDGWSFSEAASALTGVVSFGPVGLGPNAFMGAPITRLPERDIPDATKLTTLAGCFMNSSMNLPIYWDTRNVTDMSNMFNGASNFNQPLDRLDYRNLTKADNMLKNSGIDADNYCTLTDISNIQSMKSVLGPDYTCK